MAVKGDMKKRHGMSDDRWVIKDKLTQYRGLVNLYNRDKIKAMEDSTKLRKKQWRQIHDLKKDCQYLRSFLGDTMYGDKQRLRNALQEFKTIQLAFEGKRPDRVITYLDHLLHTSRKELDKLRYKSKRRMEVFKSLQCEQAELEDHLREEEDKTDIVTREEQIILNRIEEVTAKKNAATAIKTSYDSMLAILQKDSWYFDTVLNSLRQDSRVQCRCILRATEMGQVATEELANIRDEYRVLEKQVKINIKERDRAVRQVRRAVDELYLQCKMLTRVEMDHDPKMAGKVTSDMLLAEELKDLEESMKEMKEITLVPTYDDIFPRMLDQFEQRKRLLHQMERNTQLRDELLYMKNNANVMLASLQHTVVESTFQYKESKLKLLTDINKESAELKTTKSDIEGLGQTLALIRIALQTLFEMLNRIRDPSEEKPREEEEKAEAEAEAETEVEGDAEAEAVPEVENIPIPMEEDALKLVKMISIKLSILMAHATEILDTQRAEQAKQMYQRQIIDKLNLAEFGDVDEVDIPLVVDLEADDAAVLSRSDIKTRSKKIIEHYEKTADTQPAMTQRVSRSGSTRRRTTKW